MDVERFNSDLGEVAITESHIERERDNEEEWNRIKEHFSEEKLVDEVHFSEIDDMRVIHGSVYPNIEIKVDGSWKRIFFHIGDPVDECFEELQYRLKIYSQIY